MADAKHDGTGWDEIDPFDADDPHFWMKIEHLGRYLFAADYLQEHNPGSVADISCGTGYGAAELARVAEHVVGVDSNPEMLSATAARADDDRVSLIESDLNDGDLRDHLQPAGFDAVVCFETLEHLTDPGRALAGFSDVLRPGGSLICSVPDARFEYQDQAGLPKNRYHRHLFRFDSFSRLLAQHGFEVLYRLGQAWPNRLLKRETDLLKQKAVSQTVGSTPALHSTEMIRLFAYLLAYPTVEAVEDSYSIIVVAQSNADGEEPRD